MMRRRFPDAKLSSGRNRRVVDRTILGKRRVWGGLGRSLALWLGLVALTIQGLVPLCAAGPAAASGGNAIVICTSHGFETLQLDADGNPVPGAPQADHSTCFLCLGCHIGASFTAPAFVAFSAPQSAQRQAPFAAETHRLTRPAHVSYVSRAPPAAAGAIAV
jgi:hypothetical protein